MRHIEAFIFRAVHLYFITQVSGLNLDKARKALSTLNPKELGVSKSVNCKNLKCPSEEHVCAKLRTNIEHSPINTLIMVMNKCEFELMQCNEGMEAIELPMKYCRHKQASENARKAPSNRRPKQSLDNGDNARFNRRSKRSPDIATRIPKNNLASQGLRKRLKNNKPKINYNSLYFGPKSRKDADAEDSAEAREEESSNNKNVFLTIQTNNANRDVQAANAEGEFSKESANRHLEVDPENGVDDEKKISLSIQTNNANRDVEVSKSSEANNANRDVQVSNDEGEPSKESANRNQEVDPENGVDDEKKISLTIQTNNADRDAEVTNSAEADNANRDVQASNDEGEPSKESANRDQEIDVNDGAADEEQRQKISLIIQTNGDVAASNENDNEDESNKARNDKENVASAEAEGSDEGNQKVVLMIDPGNGNRQVEDDNVDETENDQNTRDAAVSEDDKQGVKPKAIDEGDDEDQNAGEAALEEENEIDGKRESKELKDEEGNDENDGNVGVMIENTDGADVDVIIGNTENGETLGGQEEDSDKDSPNRLDNVGDVLDGDPEKQKNKENSVEQDRSSIEGGNKPPDYEDVDIDEYKSDCPSVCPARDVMVCARCKEGVYRTFLSVCHLRMFNCKHPEEKLELVRRSPCMMSAPFLNDMPKAQGRVGEPGDKDNIFEYLRCKGKSALRDPKCKRRANEEARKRRHKI